jgi:iron complex transport system substrate-binding protein
MARLLLSLFAIITLFGCQDEEKIDSLAQSADVSSIYEIEFADHFTLNQEGDKVSLNIINPEDGSIEKTIKIQPSKDAKIISLSATLNGMLVDLGKTKNLVGISSAEYIYSNKIKKRFEKGSITEYGDETTQSVEKIIASGATFIFHSGFGDKFPNQDQLEKIGITVIPIYDWREEDPLGKAEWIKLIGAITKSEEKANDHFNFVKADYARLKKIAENVISKPSVLSGNMLGDIWYAPVGDSYVAQLIKDAEGSYVYKNSKGTGSLALSIETILKDNANTEIWINPGIETKAKVLKMNPHAKHLKCFDNMYCYSTKMNKFWEQSASQPNLFLSDLIHVFHPELEEIKKFNFYKKIK